MRSRRRLSQHDLQAAGVIPGLMARRYDADGRVGGRGYTYWLNALA
jgi:hypothetical protein